MNRRRFLIIVVLLSQLLGVQAVKLRKPQHFKHELPAGNYSGVAPLGGERYAVVSDKSAEDGFFVFHLHIDSASGRITEVVNEGFRSSGLKNRDMEGIVYCPTSNTLFISGEADNEVYEYRLDGQRTGRRLQMPDCFKRASRNFGLESLAYDTLQHRFYTTTERPLPGEELLRIQSFGDDLQPARQYLYRPDAPVSRKYFHGVAELCALGDGRLIVLERQIRVPRLKIGAKTIIRLYEVTPAESDTLQKRMIVEFTTRINIVSRRFANYEGLCAPLPGWLLLVADSQNRQKGWLRDWWRLINYAEGYRNERTVR